MKLLSPDHIARMATATEWQYPDHSYCTVIFALLEPLLARTDYYIIIRQVRRSSGSNRAEDYGEALIAVVDALEREEAA